jgi:aminoglycoside phosphotransferase (APT) family kinase protein
MVERSTLPRDDALPQLRVLVEASAVAPALMRSLGPDAAARLPAVRFHCLRYKPGTSLVVHYRVALGGEMHHATVMVASDSSMAELAGAVANQLLARQVDGRSPAAKALHYDEELDALVQWLPLDVELPALALTPVALAEHLRGAGIETGSREPTVVRYRPRTVAVLRLDDHILKIYRAEATFGRAVRGLQSVADVGVRTPTLEASFHALRMTVQTVVAGAKVESSPSLAEDAGRLLSLLHASPVGGLEPVGPAGQLERSGRSARLLGQMIPGLRGRVERLMAQLGELQPDGVALVRSHGDFYAGQLLVDDQGPVLVDLDAACLAAPARDMASYAARLVHLQDPDPGLDAARAGLEALIEGYGARPAGLPWYAATEFLRRAPFPFRYLPERWRDCVVAQLDAAEGALRW